jgi:hypothetical protein
MTGTVEVKNQDVVEPDGGAVYVSLERKNAMSYVENVLKNNDLAAIYKKNGGVSDVQLHGLAFNDFINPPQIIGIFCDKYLNNKAKPIMIRTRKDISGVSKVMVKIFNKEGQLLEKGLAKQFLQNERWFYFVRNKIECDQELHIVAKAVDYPGNLAVASQWIGL